MSPEKIMMDPIRILVVDDDESVLGLLREVLSERSCAVTTTSSFEEAVIQIGRGNFAVAVVDIVLGPRNGLELVTEIKSRSKETEVVMMTSHASMETAIEALHRGAYDYVRKPFEQIEEIWFPIRRAIERWDLARENARLIRELAGRNLDLDRTVHRLTSLNSAGRAMGSIYRIQDLLDYFVQLVASELQVDRVSLMLIDQKERLLKIVSSHGISAEVAREVRVRLGDGVAGWVAQKGKPILVKDATADPRITEPKGAAYVTGSFISSPIVLSIPIKMQEKTLGVINVTHKRSGQPFTDDDMVFLYSLAGQAAVAIEGARHFEELEQTYESLKAAQNQLVSSERLNALGQMAAGVAHDFNNILNGVLSSFFLTRQNQRI